MNKKFFDVWFSSLCIENTTKLKLLKKYNAKEIWYLDEKCLNENKVCQEEINQILNCKSKSENEGKIKIMEKQGIDLISVNNNQYPKKLHTIENKPAYLYIRGSKENFENDSVAIVGCRESTNLGNSIARKLARTLADNSITIVSGLAIGIDKNAHLGALDSDIGKTIAVLGGGINDESIYPLQNKKVFERIIESGGTIVSEYSIFAEPEREHFPMRNRIISGLSDKVVVVEAKERSGSLITAGLALEQGRDVYAVPRKYLF